MVGFNGFSLQVVVASALLLVIITTTVKSSSAASTQNGEEARWLVSSSKWATLSWVEEGALKSMVMSFAAESKSGRIFLYLTENITFKASLTISEAQLDPSQYHGARCGPDGDLDPQDPRCGKLTITGVVSPIKEEDPKQLALDTLFATHPQMADWPDDHGFIPCEMKINDTDGIWMIANFGGGGVIDAEEYHNSKPVQHAVQGFGDDDDRRSLEGYDEPSEMSNVSSTQSEKHGHEKHEHDKSIEGHSADHDHVGDLKDSKGTDSNGETQVYSLPLLTRPDFGKDAAGHARWITSKSLWTTISTISSKNEDTPFGNIRSIADGQCFLGSTGLPIFYLPSPDPTYIDIQKDNKIALSFTEAALAERVGDDGIPCGGEDAESPVCAKLTLIGHAKPLEATDQIELAKKAFKVQHPRAGWLSKGGAHTGGSFYTIHLHEIMFLRNFGGFTHVSAEEYLSWSPDPSKFSGEVLCEKGASGDMVSSDSTQQSFAPSSSISAFAIFLVLVASFVGSFLGGMLSKRANWSGRSGYEEARGADNTIMEIEERGVESKEWA